MGWSFNCFDYGRAAHIAEITSQKHFAAGYKPLEHRVVGNHVWQLVEIVATGQKIITLDLIAKERNGGWGYKGMDETWGPCYYDCPLSLLDKASPTESAYAQAWREKVRAHHAKKKAARKALTAGMHLEYGGEVYRLDVPAGPRRGWFVTHRAASGDYRMQYRLKASQVAAGRVVA